MDVAEATGGSPPPVRQMRIRGIHHVTAISSDITRTVAFYRDLLGMTLIKEGVNIDDPSAKHFYFGDAEGAPGTVLTFMEYQAMEPATIGTGATHHIALRVSSQDELAAWRDYLASHGVECTPVMDRTYFHSIYFKDPDGHVLELATEGPGFQPEQ